MRVLRQADGAGQSLASSFNIAAFNLGNALGAWLGSVVIAHGPGLGALSGVAALLPLAALAISAYGLALERRTPPTRLVADAAAATCHP
jgi:DHA1 family inner membrane transport protein